MINVFVVKSKTGDINSFEVKDHGAHIVCAAVSVLVQNCVNSIEVFTHERFDCTHDENGGYIAFCLKERGDNAAEDACKAQLLLNSMLLGLKGIEDEYPDDIEITIKEE